MFFSGWSTLFIHLYYFHITDLSFQTPHYQNRYFILMYSQVLAFASFLFWSFLMEISFVLHLSLQLLVQILSDYTKMFCFKLIVSVVCWWNKELNIQKGFEHYITISLPILKWENVQIAQFMKSNCIKI